MDTDPEDKAAAIQKAAQEALEKHERDLADPTLRFMQISTANGLVLSFGAESVEQAQSALMQVAAGELATFVTEDGRELIFPPGSITMLSRLSYRHRIADQGAMQANAEANARAQAIAGARNGRTPMNRIPIVPG
jgi:hypothetical protein